MAYSALADESDEFPVHLSTRAGGEPWPVGDTLENCELKAYGALRRTVTGVSSDGLTLFFYDPASAESRAGWRATRDAPFDWFVGLGARLQMQPNEDCTRLYFFTSEQQSTLSFATAG